MQESAGTTRSSYRAVPWQLSFLALGVVWGCSFWWIKLALRSLTPIDVAFGRLALGALILFTIAAGTSTPLPHRRDTWRHLFVLALFLNSAPFTLLAIGEIRVSAALAGIINALTPAATFCLSITLFRIERPSYRQVAGLGLGFGGVLIVCGIWQGVGNSQLVGIGACLLSVLSFGIAFLYAARFLAHLPDPPLSLAAGQVVCGAVQLLPFVVLFGRVPEQVYAGPIAGMIGLGALSTGFAYILNFYVVREASATVASSVTYLIPIVAVVVGAIFLGERLAWFQPLGGGIIVLGATLLRSTTK